MAIHIEEVNAKGLGPLDEFVGKLGKFNLIYSRNEKGKTFLVEFLLKSLFKNINVFKLRDINPTGNVLVSGLESETCQFSPTSRKKLEDYWEENVLGMPTNVAQLLVVKGAELDFVDDMPSGVSKRVVKSFLSSEKTLEFIQDKIQLTVQDARIENGEVLGNNRGELSKRDKILNDLNQIENILNKVNQDYSGGRLTALFAKEEELQEKKSNQEKAKRYLAYTLSTTIQEHEDKNRYMEERGLQNSIEQNNELNRKTDELQKKDKKLKNAKEKSKHYEWISTAIDEYEKLLNQGAAPPKRINFILSASLISGAALLTIIGFLLYMLDLNIIGAFIFCVIGIVIVLGMLFGFLFYRQQQKREGVLEQSRELERIETAYQEKFDMQLTDIATLKSHQQSIQKDYYETQTLNQEVKDIESEINLLRTQITNGFEKLGISCEDESKWKELIKQQEETYLETKILIHKINVELANLAVDSIEYLEVDPKIQYEKEELTRSINNLEDVHTQIREEEYNLDLLKTEIRTAISDQTTASWEKLLENMSQHRLELIESYKKITSGIVAGITVTQVIEEARKQEDEKLKVVLGSPIVQKPMFDITKRYKEVSFDGENLRVSDKFEEYNIADLSTAAREQVLLALRLGFAAKIMKQETAFLLLDDAFQHSDWQRREYLLDTMISLANNGWQIIYFSMDDHIRDLFNTLGKETFKSDYHYYELKGDN